MTSTDFAKLIESALDDNLLAECRHFTAGNAEFFYSRDEMRGLLMEAILPHLDAAQALQERVEQALALTEPHLKQTSMSWNDWHALNERVWKALRPAVGVRTVED